MVKVTPSPPLFMWQNRLISISVGTCLLLLTAGVHAGWFGADFSADMVQGSNRGQHFGGKMYVSHGRVRTEMEQNGVSVIEIIDPVAGSAWLIDMKQKRYRERAVPKIGPGGGQNANPCYGIQGAECRQLPDEVVQGRNTHKWSLRFHGNERLQWNDAQHGFPVQVFEGGHVVMSMVYLGEGSQEGRRIEHWRAMQYHADGIIESEQWYDPQLNIAVRQQAKDGSFRALKNIRLGVQKSELFVLPPGLSKIEEVAQ